MKNGYAIVLALLLPIGAFAAETGEFRAVLPVAGSLRGGFGANFKTSAQLSNRTDRLGRGELVFHPANAPAAPNDPRIAYSLAPHQTVYYDDVVSSMSAQGLGSVDVVVFEGAVPAIVMRAYDENAEGTSGTSVPIVDPLLALAGGQTTTLLVPGDLNRYRFNTGIRSLGGGATVRMTVWGQNGIARFSVERSFGPNFFTQQPVNDFVGTPLLSNESIGIEILGGSAVIYGTTTDNKTNDPAIQLATRDAVAK